MDKVEDKPSESIINSNQLELLKSVINSIKGNMVLRIFDAKLKKEEFFEVDGFIEEKVKLGKIKFNPSGEVTELDISQLSKMLLLYKLNGQIPESIGQLSKLTRLNLANNEIFGNVPASIGELTQLAYLNLSNNTSLTGHLPVTPINCEIIVNGTGISQVSVKVKKLRKDCFYLDYWLVMLYIVLGYSDLVSDIFAIRELFAVDRIAVGCLNIAFLVMNVLLGLLSATSIQDVFITIFQFGGLVEGVKTLINGEQTSELVAGKKLDAVARSMPSMVLQLFSLLISLSTINGQSYSILAVSIALGALGSATTLASIAPKSGRHLFKSRFFIHIVYYFSELLLRIMIISIMFLSIRAVAFVVVGVDWLLRLFIISCDPQEYEIVPKRERIDISLSILYFGSDDAISLDQKWILGNLINIIELFTFLVIINIYETDDLDILREDNTTRNITIISCAALLVKTLMHYVIQRLPDEIDDEYSTPGKEGADDIITGIADVF